MDESSLAKALQRPELHRELLGDYDGAYALGITSSPENKDRIALLLRIEGVVPKEIPTHIAVDGEQVPVIVQGGFKAAKRQ